MWPVKRKPLDVSRKRARMAEKAEQLKASAQSEVEHTFRLVKQQFGHAKVRYRGLSKNTARLTMLFALGSLWTMRRQLLEAQA